jgi:hypothetical protein
MLHRLKRICYRTAANDLKSTQQVTLSVCNSLGCTDGKPVVTCPHTRNVRSQTPEAQGEVGVINVRLYRHPRNWARCLVCFANRDPAP